MAAARESKEFTQEEVMKHLTQFQSVSLIESAKLLLAHDMREEINFEIRWKSATDEKKQELFDWVENMFPGHLNEEKANDERMKLLTPREKSFLGIFWFHITKDSKVENSLPYLMQASKDDKLSCVYLGSYYHYWHSPPDFKKAKEYYEQEHPKSFNFHADILEKENKLEKAFLKYKKGAKLNDPRALSNLGLCYELGTGCNQDLNKALLCYQKAVMLGGYTALKQLGYIYYAEGDDRKALIYFRLFTKYVMPKALGFNESFIKNNSESLSKNNCEPIFHYHFPICFMKVDDEYAATRRKLFNNLRREKSKLFYDFMEQMPDNFYTFEPLLEFNDEEKERVFWTQKVLADTSYYFVSRLIIHYVEFPSDTHINTILKEATEKEKKAAEIIEANKSVLPSILSLFGDKGKEKVILIEQAEQGIISFQRAARSIYGSS